MTTNPSNTADTVVYVEDEPVNVLLMQMLFEYRPQYRLEVATTGREALDMAPEVQPSLLMLDLRLPDCHGAQLLPLLRQTRGWHDVPAVAVTAESHFELADTGFLEVWRKPIDLRRVLARLDELIEGTPATPWAVDRAIGRLRGTRLLKPAPVSAHR